MKCYEFRGYGHYAKNCANRRNRAGASNAEVKSTIRGTGKKVHEKREKSPSQPAGGKVKKDSENCSAHHLFFSYKAAGYHQVRITQQKEAPLLKAIIDYRPRMLLIDTGSRVSLIQPRVCGAKVTPNKWSSYALTVDELDIKGQQSVQFILNGH